MVLSNKQININSYFQQICENFKRLISINSHFAISPLCIDCANGIGAKHLSTIKKILEPALDYIKVCNTDSSGKIINLQCGADYIKVLFYYLLTFNSIFVLINMF